MRTCWARWSNSTRSLNTRGEGERARCDYLRRPRVLNRSSGRSLHPVSYETPAAAVAHPPRMHLQIGELGSTILIPVVRSSPYLSFSRSSMITFKSLSVSM